MSGISDENQRHINSITEKSVRSRRQAAKIKEAINEGTIDRWEFVAGRLAPLEAIIADWPIGRVLWRCCGLHEDSRFRVLAEVNVRPKLPVRDIPPETREKIADLVMELKSWGYHGG